jgi:protease-4
VAASGGYWIAMGSDEVWAYPNTITGSIGIITLFPTFQNTLDEVGIHTDGFGVTPLAGAFRADRELPEPARRVIQAVIEQGYEEFIELVARGRDLDVARVRDVAEGRVWTGAQARERGLIDQLGTLEQAVDSAARMAGIGDDYDTVYVQRQFSPLDRFFANMGAQALAHSGLHRSVARAAWWPGRDLYRSLVDQFARVARASTGRTPAEPMAHCLCEAPL